MSRASVVVAVALPLAGVDLLWKGIATTPAWAYHARSPAWLVLSLGLVAGAVALSRVRSRLVPAAAGLLAGGVLGNSLSAAWNGLRVPDPIVASSHDAVIAFNLADVFTLAGLLALTAILSTALVRNRHLLATPQEVRARRDRLLRRRR